MKRFFFSLPFLFCYRHDALACELLSLKTFLTDGKSVPAPKTITPRPGWIESEDIWGCVSGLGQVETEAGDAE